MTKYTCSECGKPRRRDSHSGRCGKCYREGIGTEANAHGPQKPLPDFQQDRARVRAATAHAETKLKLNQALAALEQAEAERDALIALNETPSETFAIRPVTPGGGTNEGTAVIVASDWHLEEEVKSGTVSGLNTFNLDVAKARAEKFWQSAYKLIRLLNQDIRITHLVVAFLGDFITGQIHGAENAESNLLLPNHAIVFAKGLLVAGLDFLLASTAPDVRIHIPCHSGNHARTTHTTRFTSENGHSLEFLMYMWLASHYRHEPRITFDIAEGMHSYLDIYGTTIRFHHGHAVKYNGGVGGLYIPVNKAIAQWNKGRHADLDVFGHFHQLRDGGNFICNGSLIGYNTFALSIKADYEPPRQCLFLMDKKRGRTCTWPILVE